MKSLVSILRTGMGFSAQSTPDPLSDFWFKTSPGTMSASGIRVGPESAEKLSAYFRGRQLVAGTVAMLPLDMFTRRDDGGKDVAHNHPLRDLLRGNPNRWQTALDWRQLMTMHAIDRGNGYSYISPGARGPVDELIPLNPDRVTPEQQPDHSIKYRFHPDQGPQQTLFQDEVFHLPGLAYDGVKGKGVLECARESLGIGLAQEQYAARFFSQSEVPPIILRSAGPLSKQAREANKEAWTQATGTWGNKFRAAILEGGIEAQTLNLGLTAEQAQLLESRSFTVADLARWIGIPPHMLGETTKETSWGSGIEQMSIGFVVYTLLWWLKNWEQRISFSLVLAPQTYFAEHNVDGLLRGDGVARATALNIWRNAGILNANEWRALENLNPIDPAEGDGSSYWRPANMVDSNAPSPLPGGPGSPPEVTRQALIADLARNMAAAGEWRRQSLNGAGGH